MKNSTISFKSNIKFVNREDFTRKVATFSEKSFIGDPWSIKQTERVPQFYTKDIEDCTAGGILVKSDLSDKLEIIPFHTSWMTSDNLDFEKVEQVIFSKLGKDEPIQGFLLGSRSLWRHSTAMFDRFESLMQSKLRIPYTKFKEFPEGDKVFYANIAYDGAEDQWTVFAEHLEILKNNMVKNLKKYFADVLICDKDKVV